MTVFGWDASDFDWDRGPMDVAAGARDGIVLLTHKLTEGRGNRHVHAGTVLARGRDAGIPLLGGYHVVHTTDVPGQVAYLLAYADQVVPWWRSFPGWFWQCDAERWDTDFPPPTVVKAFCDQLAARTGRTVICYASKGQYGDTLAGLGHPLWNASYGTDPAGHYRELYPGDASPRWGAYSGQVPVLLQYGSRLTIGSQPTCDANAYRGSLDQLRALITGQGAGMDLDYTDANFGNAKESIYSAYRVVGHALLTGEDPIGNLWWLGKPGSSPNLLWQLLRRIDTTVAADLAEDKATTAALKALVDQVNVAGGSLDAAPILAAIAAARAEESAAVTALHDQVADLTRRLTAAEQAAAAALTRD